MNYLLDINACIALMAAMERLVKSDLMSSPGTGEGEAGGC
jgi:hypothetical protein